MSTGRKLTPRERGVPRFVALMEPLVATKAGGWFYTRVAMRLDRILIPLTGGRLTMSLTTPNGMLEVRGRKSGELRKVPMLYVPLDGGRIALVASNAGQPRHPAWYHNMKADPDVAFTAKGRTRRYRARLVEGEERAAVWERATRVYSGYDTYEDRADGYGRSIGVFVLDPVEDAASS